MDNANPMSDDVLPKVQRSALSEDVYSSLREVILRGRLKPDQRIVEERLAAQLGVSRAPLREAIWQLKADGLIVGAGRSTRVVALSQRDIRELHLLRTTLETTLYQSAATVISEKEIEALDRLVRKMEMVTASEQCHQQIAQLDFEFHQSLCEVPDLPRVRSVWEDQHVLFRLWLNVVAEAEDDPMAIARHHRILLEAVVDGDPSRIAVETARHVYLISDAFHTERRRWIREHAEQAGDPYHLVEHLADGGEAG
ncbi:GntR family transcriptional regulator [Jiangella asiatica]|uniref:GntR family transcriptional regulator n=1 Tax=Jiangella asiatica TaxID=2530372 RepID=UPI0013A5E2DF|nr:GntR family transcriptional regulator [Jiangella asiatica]